jgi:hypothetical protein
MFLKFIIPNKLKEISYINYLEYDNKAETVIYLFLKIDKCGGLCLSSQHSGGWGSRVKSLRPVWASEKTLSQKTIKPQKKTNVPQYFDSKTNALFTLKAKCCTSYILLLWKGWEGFSIPCILKNKGEGEWKWEFNQMQVISI